MKTILTILIDFFLISVLTFSLVSCAARPPLPESNMGIYTPSASQADVYRKEAKRMMNDGDWRGARLKLIKALDAKKELGDDKDGFMPDLEEAAEKSGTCEFANTSNILAFPQVYRVNGKIIKIMGMQWYILVPLGDNYFGLCLPEGTLLAKSLKPFTIKGKKAGIFRVLVMLRYPASKPEAPLPKRETKPAPQIQEHKVVIEVVTPPPPKPEPKKEVCIEEEPVKAKEPTLDELEKAWQKHLRKSRDCNS